MLRFINSQTLPSNHEAGLPEPAGSGTRGSRDRGANREQPACFQLTQRSRASLSHRNKVQGPGTVTVSHWAARDGAGAAASPTCAPEAPPPAKQASPPQVCSRMRGQDAGSPQGGALAPGSFVSVPTGPLRAQASPPTPWASRGHPRVARCAGDGRARGSHREASTSSGTASCAHWSRVRMGSFEGRTLPGEWRTEEGSRSR